MVMPDNEWEYLTEELVAKIAEYHVSEVLDVEDKVHAFIFKLRQAYRKKSLSDPNLQTLSEVLS